MWTLCLRVLEREFEVEISDRCRYLSIDKVSFSFSVGAEVSSEQRTYVDVRADWKRSLTFLTINILRLSACRKLFVTSLPRHHPAPTPLLSSSAFQFMKRKRFDPSYSTSTSANSTALNSSATGSASSDPLFTTQASMFSGRGGGRGGGSARNANHNKRPKPSTAKPSPIANPPLHNLEYIKSCWMSLGGRGQPNPKWADNSKGIIANYLTTLGESVTYKSGKARVGAFEGFR